MGHFEKKRVINFKTENEPKMKLYDFWAFQKQMHMPSREKYIFHMRFGTFHNTSRIYRSKVTAMVVTTNTLRLQHGRNSFEIFSF